MAFSTQIFTKLKTYQWRCLEFFCADFQDKGKEMWGLHVESSLKSKAIPLQAWTNPEGTRRLRLPDFKTIGT